MFTQLFSAMFSYDPATLPADKREQMAEILKARGEILRVQAEVVDLRAQSWAGVPGASDLAEIKAQDLAKARLAWVEKAKPFVVASVDTDSLMELLPMIIGGVLQSFKVPLPVVLEALGADVDNLKVMVEALKELLEDL